MSADARPPLPLPGQIAQCGYLVEDLERSLEAYTTSLGIGPWFLRGPFSPEHARYRGEPCPMSITLARAYSGSLMIELIAQHDDVPSIFTEALRERGYGFHHWATFSLAFESDLAGRVARGDEVVFSDLTPNGARIAYLTAAPGLAGMLELIELTPTQEQGYRTMMAAAAGWDGSDPRRVL
jgi:Glyoxalase/Bleomycin resistance protein/Dioxygenase superfamily